MPRHRFFDPQIHEYVRERLVEECKVRGVAAEIARETQTSRAHIANILDGTRRVGEDFAAAVAKYWRLSQGELHQLAQGRQASRALEREQEPLRTHPNLDTTLEFCRGVYPDVFLSEYEDTARRVPDRPKMEWLTEIHTRLYAWIARQTPAIQKRYLHLLGVPLPAFATSAARGGLSNHGAAAGAGPDGSERGDDDVGGAVGRKTPKRGAE